MQRGDSIFEGNIETEPPTDPRSPTAVLSSIGKRSLCTAEESLPSHWNQSSLRSVLVNAQERPTWSPAPNGGSLLPSEGVDEE